MSAIDVVILGLIMTNKVSAYEIQKEIEYRKISKWVRISTLSIYKKVLQFEKKEYIIGEIVEGSSTQSKSVYSITPKGEEYYFTETTKIISDDVTVFLDFNSSIVNFNNFSQYEQKQQLLKIQSKITDLDRILDYNMSIKTKIPKHGKQILKQQKMLTQTLLTWVSEYLLEYS